MKKETIIEFARYVVVGGIAAIVDMGVNYLTLYNVLHSGKEGTWQVAVSVAAGFLVGLAVNFILSNHFVFKDAEQQKRGKSVNGFVLSFLVGVIGFALTELLTMLGTNFIPGEGLFYLLLTCAVKGVVLIWNYLGRKFIVYNPIFG